MFSFLCAYLLSVSYFWNALPSTLTIPILVTHSFKKPFYDSSKPFYDSSNQYDFLSLCCEQDPFFAEQLTSMYFAKSSSNVLSHLIVAINLRARYQY